MSKTFNVISIGKIDRSEKNPKIVLDEKYRSGLLELDNFSHVIVVWWGDKYEEYRHQVDMQMYPPYAPEILTGLFATRSPVKPNPILTSVCKITGMNIEKGELVVNEIDAFDGTPVLDIKAYFPTEDRVKDFIVPDRFKEWGDWLPEDGVKPEYYE